MSTQNGHVHEQSGSTNHRGSGFPWLPVLAVAGVAAAAFFIVRRMQDGEDGALTVDHLLDRCEQAASTLDARIMGHDIDLLAS